MKSEIVGHISHLRPSEKRALEKLSTKRSKGHEFVDFDILRAASAIAATLEAQIGLLIGRDGYLAHVIVGTKNRLYLPDLGRYRLDSARLRRLRYVVFIPQTEQLIERRTLSPTIPQDLLTDLQKLRFDGLLVVAVKDNGLPGAVSFASLDPGATTPGTLGKTKEWSIRFQQAKDFQGFTLDFPEFIADLEQNITVTTKKSITTGADRALLVGVYTGSETEAKSSMEELKELCYTAGIEVLDVVIQRRRNLDPKTVMGRGKIEDLVLQSLDVGADLLIFDRELAPGQLRNITNITELRVIDRSMLILDIFAQRAVSSEGRLQVELAQLKYSLPRLTERDSGLSRLTGGIGGRGPGETKLEISRRRARDRISNLEQRIDKLTAQRGLRRERRQERGVPVIAIVGYTNAGKSTLLNALTKGDVFVENKMFATLDPTSRRMRFPNEREVLFVDTVGFIRELPEELLAAFRATLEEVSEADVLVHLVDATNIECRKQIQVVEETLADLGMSDKPTVLVLNKIDQLHSVETRSLVNTLGGILISARTRQGFPELMATLQDMLAKSFKGLDPGSFTALPL